MTDPVVIEDATVRPHRVEWVGDTDPTWPWRVVLYEGWAPHHISPEQGEAMGLTPPPPTIDFDALPIGTVLRGKGSDSRYCVVKTNTGEWTWVSNEVGGPVWTAPIKWRVVHVPAAAQPPSTADALHTLGLTNDDIELIAGMNPSWSVFDKVIAAAREAVQR